MASAVAGRLGTRDEAKMDFGILGRPPPGKLDHAVALWLRPALADFVYESWRP